MPRPMYNRLWKKLKQMEDSTKAKWQVVRKQKQTSDKEFWSFVEYVLGQPIKIPGTGAGMYNLCMGPKPMQNQFYYKLKQMDEETKSKW